jgi:hypothetical protein
MVYQAKLKSFRRKPFWKFGVMVPRTHNQAVEIDQANGNQLWQDLEATEMKQLAEEHNTLFLTKARVVFLLATKGFVVIWFMMLSTADVTRADLLLEDTSRIPTLTVTTLVLFH